MRYPETFEEKFADENSFYKPKNFYRTGLDMRSCQMKVKFKILSDETNKFPPFKKEFLSTKFSSNVSGYRIQAGYFHRHPI